MDRGRAWLGLIVIVVAYMVAVGSWLRFWGFASTVHRLTPYPNLNGVITCLAIPLIAFLISARWEKIARGEMGVFAEFGRIAAIVYSTIAIVALSFSIGLLLNGFSLLELVSFSRYPEDRSLPLVSWLFLILPIAASTLLRFLTTGKIVLLVGSLMFLPHAVLIALLIISAIINAIGSWLFRTS
ncbi:MAG: hypothetical protein KatS3mg087_2164 [Patescibacteria group bacterium]|nr:MAG: hypothetical protein KatS3mg087_2164 [Patescibacteria group bacterium]